MRVFFVGLSFLLISLNMAASSPELAKVKAEIIALAQKNQGKGDPDRKIQNSLEPLVQRLLKLNPQPSVKKRLKLIAGTWKQVWGAYDYRGNARGVDPSLKTDEIYQQVSPKGYYYNVSPLLKENYAPRIGLLKGRYKLDPKNPNVLEVKFIKYPGNRTRPQKLELWDLPELAEKGELPDPVTIVPRIIVWLFFGKGRLNEVYTDEDLRITYGSSRNKKLNDYLYIMTRVKAL